MEGKNLKASYTFTPRFAEVDSMNVVWHGSYSLYLEDAREAFGRKYDLGYLQIFSNGYYAPLVDLAFKFKQPIIYGMECRIDITMRPTDAAKIIFDYEIYDTETGTLRATAHTVQVFMDMKYQLVWITPDFFEEWKKKWL